MSVAGSNPTVAARLRILHVVPTYYPAVRYGGPIRSVHGLASALARRGHDVHVYTTNMDGETDMDVALDRPVELDGVHVRYFSVPRLRRLCWSPGLEQELRRTVSSFDIVHLHSVFLLPTRAAARAAAGAGVPYVLAPRGMLVRDMIRRRNRWIKTLWIALVEQMTVAHAAGLHATAELEAQELRALFGAVLPEVMHVPNGVEWPAEHLPLDATPFAALPRPYALFLSRISWKKGLDRLLRAWRDVPDLPLVIAGNDDENYLPTLEALARSLGVAHRVRFVGAVSDAHKWALYESAELFVLPSYSENFGNVVAEAMAMACPVIVSPEVGIASLVQQEAAGIVTDCEPESLVGAIHRLRSDPAARLELGRRGRQAVRRRLSWDGIAAQMEEGYRRLLARRVFTEAVA
ncbi:MAG TPA: glycosyltransferase [Steroidobacteraceae bacterium]|nr:glycosyltransferase [Steroidobacteraceae bacterium]